MFKLIVLSVAVTITWFVPGMPASACEVGPARAVMDQLLDLDIATARNKLAAWPQDENSAQLHTLYSAMTTLVNSYNDGTGVNQHYKDEALAQLRKLSSVTEKRINRGDADPETRFVHGMAEAYISAILLSKEKQIRAYTHAQAGREALQNLVNEHPEMEDAYLVLGMFEYFLGSIPDDLKSKARLMGMEGDKDLGLSYLERAVENAPISAPEAARVLLLETGLPEEESCRYQPLADLMHQRYPRNELFTVTARIIALQCRIAEAEGRMVAAPVSLSLHSGCTP
jgi:hypothetical protein